MRRIITIAMLLLSVLTTSAQFAFRISDGGLKEPSYLFGTIHLLPGNLLDTCSVYLEAEASCRQLYVESNVTDQQKREEQTGEAKQLMTLPDSLTIFDVMGAERMKLLQDRLLENHINLNDSASMPYWRMKPMFFTSLLNSIITIEVIRQCPLVASSTGGIMDVTCITRANNLGWKIGELDHFTEEEKQTNIKNVFDSQSLEAQVDTLMALVNNFEERKQKELKESERIAIMMDCWQKGDYDSFETNNVSEAENNPELIIRRNKKWLPIMIDAMKENPTLFVFGSLHLIGSSGVVSLLRDAGYKVEQMISL